MLGVSAAVNLRKHYGTVEVGVQYRISEQLIALLGAQFPDQAPTLDLSEREIMFRAGQVSVVKWLAARLEEQGHGLDMEGF